MRNNQFRNIFIFVYHLVFVSDLSFRSMVFSLLYCTSSQLQAASLRQVESECRQCVVIWNADKLVDASDVSHREKLRFACWEVTGHEVPKESSQFLATSCCCRWYSKHISYWKAPWQRIFLISMVYCSIHLPGMTYMYTYEHTHELSILKTSYLFSRVFTFKSHSCTKLASESSDRLKAIRKTTELYAVVWFQWVPPTPQTFQDAKKAKRGGRIELFHACKPEVHR